MVATPGRLWDLIQEGHSHLSQVKDISYLAIDETDRMVEKGHFEELQNLLDMINEDETKKKRRQTFVFSATLSLIHELPKHLKDKKGAKQMTSEEKLKNLMEMIGVKPRPKIVDLSRKVGHQVFSIEFYVARHLWSDLQIFFFWKKSLNTGSSDTLLRHFRPKF